MRAERELIECALEICKASKAISTDLYSEEIKISFIRANYDNLLVVTQSMSNLYAMHFPLEALLSFTGAFADCHELASLWQQCIDEYEAKENKRLNYTIENTDTEDVEENEDE